MEEQPSTAQEPIIAQDFSMDQDSSLEEDCLSWNDWSTVWSWFSDGLFSVCDYSIYPMGFIELPSESAMDAAGRDPDQPFKDLRAARHAHQRTRRYQTRKYTGNKRRRRDAAPSSGRGHVLKDAYLAIKSREWEDDWEAEWAHNIDLEHMDDVVAYNRFGKNAHVFEQSNGGEVVVHGEDFGSWARRRTQEMRAVKEARIRQHGKETPIIPISETRQHVIPYTWRPGRIKATAIPTAPYSKPTDTTLPTTRSDIDAHAALVYVLCPSIFFVAYCRRRKIPPFQHVEGFDWFGEYTWQWHRNMSGCWVLGYGDDSCNNDCALPCDCGCNGSFIDRCYCNEFNVGTWQEKPAPEEQQRCSLVEWANGELREKMEADEEILQEQLRRGEEEDAEMQRRMDEHGESWEANFSGDEFECEWGHYWEDEYVVLESEESEASESWSVVSGVEQRRFADFTGGGSSAEQWMN